MKKLLAFLLAFMMFSTVVNAELILEYDGASHTYTGAVCSLEVNGKEVETPLHPIIFNNRALVPVREVFEAMGAEVSYSNSTQKIEIELDETFIKLQIGSPYIYINGERTTIPDGVVPKLIGRVGEYAKTMVPVRCVSENLGMTVNYDAKKQLISVDNPNQEPEITFSSTVKSIKATGTEDSVTISVALSERADNITDLVMLSSGVIYCDIYGANYSSQNRVEVGKGAVSAVRLGLSKDSAYTRVAIDTSGAEDFYKRLSEDGTLLRITVTGTAPKEEPAPDTDTDADINTKPDTKPVTPPTSSTTPPDAHLKGEKIIVLDAGHGGSDPGAVYTHDEEQYKEKVINLAVAKKVKALLEKEGITVKMTRSGDSYLTLTERSAFANELGAAMFVSIHSNSFPDNNSVDGIEVYYSKTNNSDRYKLTSKELASDIYKSLIKKTGASQRGVKTAQHVVTRTSEMPAVLIELGFITNEAEAVNLYSSSYQNLLAQAIANAIIDNMDVVKIPPDPIPQEAEELSEEELLSEDPEIAEEQTKDEN